MATMDETPVTEIVKDHIYANVFFEPREIAYDDVNFTALLDAKLLNLRMSVLRYRKEMTNGNR